MCEYERGRCPTHPPTPIFHFFLTRVVRVCVCVCGEGVCVLRVCGEGGVRVSQCAGGGVGCLCVRVCVCVCARARVFVRVRVSGECWGKMDGKGGECTRSD